MPSPYDAMSLLDFLTGTPQLPSNFPGPPPPGYYPNGSMYKPPVGTPPIAPGGQAPSQTPRNAPQSPSRTPGAAPPEKITWQGTLAKLGKLPDLFQSLEKIVLANALLLVIMAFGLLFLFGGGLIDAASKVFKGE